MKMDLKLFVFLPNLFEIIDKMVKYKFETIYRVETWFLVHRNHGNNDRACSHNNNDIDDVVLHLILLWYVLMKMLGGIFDFDRNFVRSLMPH